MDVFCKQSDNGDHSLLPIHTNVSRRTGGSGYNEVTLLLCEKCFRVFEVDEIKRTHYQWIAKEKKDED